MRMTHLFRFYAQLFLRPCRQGILNTAYELPEVRVMSLQNNSHVVVLYPVEADLRVNLFGVISRKKAVALQPACRHQNEYAKRSLAESESVGQVFRIKPCHQVNSIYVVAVNALEFFGPFFV